MSSHNVSWVAKLRFHLSSGKKNKMKRKEKKRDLITICILKLIYA